MAHKTITISTDAYEALASFKKGKESFTDVILKLSKKKKKGTLIDYIERMEPADELAEKLEEVLSERTKIAGRRVRF
ncbi:antitoxin VapB family protein [Candidatus Pyrohabitans sp.]